MSLFEISQLSHYYSRWVVRITYFYEKFASSFTPLLSGLFFGHLCQSYWEGVWIRRNT